MEGWIIGLSIFGVVSIIVIVVLIVLRNKKHSTYSNKGVEKSKTYEFIFLGNKRLKNTYNSQTITIYEDCIIVRKDVGSSVYYSRIKLFDLDQCVYEIFSDISQKEYFTLCVSLFSRTLVEENVNNINSTSWRAGPYHKVLIHFNFDYSDKILYEREMKALNEAITQALNEVRRSPEYIKDMKKYEAINSSPFMVQFNNTFGCNLEDFKKRLILVNGHNKLLDEFSVSPMSMLYDKINHKIALCVFDGEESLISNLSIEEKLLFISQSELETHEDYLELLKEASVKKLKSLFISLDSIKDIKYISEKAFNPNRKPVAGLNSSAQAEFIHPLYLDSDILKTKNNKDNLDISRYLITFVNAPYPQMYIDKMYFDEEFGGIYSFLKTYQK